MTTKYRSIESTQPYGQGPQTSGEDESLPRQPKPGGCDRCQIGCLKCTDACFPWYSWPCQCGLVALLMRRNLLGKYNLLPVEPVSPEPVPPPPGGVLPVMHRMATGHYNEIAEPRAGASMTPFGRNTPGYAPGCRREMIPDPFLVAQKLLARRLSGPNGDYFKPAGAQLNILAAAWIQAMVHDWADHTAGEEATLSGGEKYGCPMAKFKYKKTGEVPGVNGHPAYHNRRTHWWDASFIYGSNPETMARTRTGAGGKIHAGKDGVMDHNDAGVVSTGDNKNSWVGVSLLMALLSMEHNAIADVIGQAHPTWTDEEIFRKARLSTCAMVAKIHTIDWTVELLKNPILRTGMRGNWYGIIGKYLKENTFLGKAGNSVISGLANLKKPDNHGTPYKLTEDFVTVYRLHPMLPDSMDVGSEKVDMDKLVAVEGENTLRRIGAKPFWEAACRDPCGALVLFNYPQFFRSIPPTTEEGVPEPDVPIDMAVLDIYRDRSRGVPRFNDMRRALNMNPIKKWSDLTKDKEYQMALQEVYGDDVDLCDVLVGNLAEDKISGFAISETSFHIFIAMASRRIESDRFLTVDFTPEVYSAEGYKRVQDTEGIRDLLLRHFPDVANQIPKTQSGFKPWGVS